MYFLKNKVALFCFFVGMGVVLFLAYEKKQENNQGDSSSQLAQSSVSAQQHLSASVEAPLSPVKTQPASVKTNAQLESRYRSLSDNENYPTLESRLAAMSEHTQKNYDAEAVLDAMADTSIWAPASAPPKTMSLTDIELNDGREFIAINRLKVETLLPGDSLVLPIAQKNLELEINIISVEKNPNGSLTWHGEINDHDQIYFAEITQSERLTLAGVGTPNGNFALQANGGEGWLATTDTLFKRNEQVSDALVPPGLVVPDHQHE